MLNPRPWLQIAVLTSIALLDHPAASLASETNTNSPPRPVSAQRLIGKAVENSDGLRIGKLQDFSLDLQTGRLQYAVVSSDGFLGFRSRLTPVPPQLMSAGTAKRNTVALDVPQTIWKNAPSFPMLEIAELHQPAHAERVRRGFSDRPSNDTDLPGTPDSSGPEANSLTPAGRESSSGRIMDPGALTLASQISGRPLMNRQSERLGEVRDFLFRFDAESHAFAIFSSGRMLKERGRLFAVSVRALNLSSDGRVVIDANRSLLESAPLFTEQAWSEASASGSPRIFRYDPPR